MDRINNLEFILNTHLWRNHTVIIHWEFRIGEMKWWFGLVYRLVSISFSLNWFVKV